MARGYIDVNWEGADYHGFPAALAQPSDDTAAELEAWTLFADILAAAKRGDFSQVPNLVQLYDNANWCLSSACIELIAETGNTQLFEHLRPLVAAVTEPTYTVDFGCALATWGNLSVVPTLLEALRKIAEFDDAKHLLQRMSMMLEAPPGVLSDSHHLRDIDSYATNVSLQVEQLATQLNGVACVFWGQPCSVQHLVTVMRQTLETHTWFDPFLRHRFEATTGIDCSVFYRDQVLQPTQALAVLAAFEASDQAKLFVPGKRCFFGHEVPA